MENIDQAIKILKKGGVIVCPSESCYGFSCDARNKKAIQRIHKIKKEPIDKPLTVAISDINQIKEFGIINKQTEKIIKDLMPCQLNLIIPEKQPNKYSFLSQKGISFRIPTNKILFELAEKLNAPIVTTSVNIHNQPSIYKIKKVKSLFKDKVDMIIDKGDLDENIPTSTIYDTRNKKIIRQGIIKLEQIQKAANNLFKKD